jgi:hypothetical protein
MTFTAHADGEEPISTDRPDFVESSEVVGNRVVQIETGVSLDHDSLPGGYSETFTTPTLLRVGIGSNTELRIETDGRTDRRDVEQGASKTTRGYSDIALGIKQSLHRSQGAHDPSVAALLHADFASGSAAFRGVGVRPSLRVVAEWDLPANMSIGVMPGIIYDNNERHRFVNGIFAVTTGQQWTTRMHTFLEIAGQQIAHAQDGGCIATYDAGAAYLVTNDVEVDLAVSRGANDNTPEWTLAAGLSIRF